MAVKTLNPGPSDGRHFQGPSPGDELTGFLEWMKGRYYQEEPRTFAYDDFEASGDFDKLARLARCLKDFDLDALSTRASRLAFWVNLYNLMAIHGVLAHRVKHSVRDARGFFTSCCQVGSVVLSLDDVEHGILRGNARKYKGLKRFFSSSDPRRKLVLEPMEPRVHFALYSACRSSPLLDAYRAANVEQQLEHATERYLRSRVEIRGAGSKILLPRIFEWYAGDFGSREQMMRLIVDHLGEDTRRELPGDRAVEAVIGFVEFNWSLNQLHPITKGLARLRSA